MWQTQCVQGGRVYISWCCSCIVVNLTQLLLVPSCSLDMVSLLLQHHGAQVIPEEKCSIQHCQKLFRNRRRNSKGKEKQQEEEEQEDEEEQDLGVPTRICILFDPMYLEPVQEWSNAMQFKNLYGYSEMRAADEAAARGEISGLDGNRAGSLALPRPRLVTSTWVTQSHEKEFALPEEGFYPMVDSSMEQKQTISKKLNI